MRLKEIIEKTGCCTYSGSLDPEIRQLCSDSREVKKGHSLLRLKDIMKADKSISKML